MCRWSLSLNAQGSVLLCRVSPRECDVGMYSREENKYSRCAVCCCFLSSTRSTSKLNQAQRTEAFSTWHRHRLLTGATYQLLCIHHLPYNTHTMPPKAESSNAYRDEDAEEDDDDFDDLDGQFSPFPR
jgi:hypothetical protein